MANQRTYTIEIQGVKESYENVSKLADVLDKLTDKVVKVSSEMEDQTETVGKNTKQVQQNTRAYDELGKATQKLEDFDAEYEKELQRVKSELSAQKKEVSELIKQEQAQAVVEAKQLNSYADKQKYLTSLNKLIRTHADVTEEDKQEIAAMVEESAKLQQELKDWDYNMKIYTRNVGNYPGQMGEVIEANRNLKQELRSLTDEMANMLANGVDKTDPKFQSLAQRAGQLKDAMADANDEIKHFASDTKSLDNVINLAQTATSVWGLYSNAMQLFGDENEEVAESMKKMMVVMSTLQQLQTLQNALTANGSATAKVYTTVTNALANALGLKTTATQSDTTATTANAAATNAATTATNGLTVAQKAGAVASNILSTAMRAIPLMFIIGLVITLITEWENIFNWFKKTFPVIDKLDGKLKDMGGLLNTLKATFVGLGKAIINWFVNPINTAIDAISKLAKGDFSGALDAITNGFKKQFQGTADAFKEGFQEQVERGLEEISLKALKEGNKQTKQELEELKIRERNNKTYSKKYIELQKKDFEERKKLAKGNQDELNKIKLEEMQFDADCEDKKTAYAKEQENERTKNAKAAADQRKKDEEAYQKEIEKLTKAIEDATKKSNELVKNGIALNRKQIEEHLKITQKLEEESAANQQALDKKYYNTNLPEILFKRKMLIYNSFAEEAKETKEKYDETIKEINALILDATKKGLEDEVNELNRTLKRVMSNYKLLFDEYAEKDFTIPLSFDEDEIIERYKKMVDKLDIDVSAFMSLDKAFSLLTDFDKEVNTLLNTNQKGLIEAFFQMAEAITGTTDGINKSRDAFEKLKEILEGDLTLLEQLPEGFERTKEELKEGGDYTKAFASDMAEALFGTNLVISQMGVMATETKNTLKDVSNDSMENIKKLTDDTHKKVIETADKILNYYDKVISKFQEAAKGLKLEIVNVDDAFTETFGGQIMSIDKTRERYEKLRKAYEEYDKALTENRGTDQWNKKLEATEKLYGKDSNEYKLLLDEKEKADAEYLMEHEKVQEQLRQIDKKTNDIAADYAESLGNRIKDIYKAFNENMFQPIAEGFTALLDYQIEEAEERLEDIEKLLDKAVELRQDSEEKIDEINNKIKDSDKGNVEALKQQLADEQVLLVQRQQNERDLQKQKEKEEALIKRKEKQQRKIELGQKLIEAVVNGAVGVSAALRYGFPLGPIFAAIIGAMAALQVGVITKQISKLERGGKIKNSGIVGEDGHGRRHSQGGHRIEGTNIEVEMGEMVVNRRSTKKYEPLLTAINEDNPIKVRTIAAKYENGGILSNRTTIINNYHNTPLVSSSIRKYASGGQLDYARSVSAIEQNRDAYRVMDAINQIDFKPQVAVVDIEKKQKNLVKVRDVAGK